MRIISGSARGKRLETFEGTDIRPTPDRVRGAIFSILFSRLGAFQGKTVLDLYAGTGAMAIEALSRGASKAWLVDQGPQSAQVIGKNLQNCRVADRAVHVRSAVSRALEQLGGEKPFDLIFLDPPYKKGLASQTLELLAGKEFLSQDGIICAEADRSEDIPSEFGSLTRIDRRDYGTTSIHLFALTETEA